MLIYQRADWLYYPLWNEQNISGDSPTLSNSNLHEWGRSKSWFRSHVFFWTHRMHEMGAWNHIDVFFWEMSFWQQCRFDSNICSIFDRKTHMDSNLEWIFVWILTAMSNFDLTLYQVSGWKKWVICNRRIQWSFSRHGFEGLETRPYAWKFRLCRYMVAAYGDETAMHW